MDALIVYPDTKEQLTALKAVMKAMNVSFEQKAQIYPEHVIEGVKQSLKQADEKSLKSYERLKSMSAL